MRAALAAGFLAAMLGSCGPAAAQALRIGISAPLTGPSAILGAQVREGALAAAGEAELDVADDACTAEGGAAAARRFAEQRVVVAVGFLCIESIEAALPILKAAGIPAITVGVRADSLTDRRHKSGWPVFRLTARADAERTALSAILVDRWREVLFAIVDDGTIYGRELAETFRQVAEQAGLKPVFVDTFRPELDNQVGLIGRLRRAGATHVLAGGGRDDLAIIGRDAAKLGYGLVIAGGEALRAAAGEVPLQPGTLMIAMPEWSEVASLEVVQGFAVRDIVPEGYVLPAYAAMEIALKAAAEATGNGRSATQAIQSGSFETAIGTIRFDEKGDLAENPYRLFSYTGTRFVLVGPSLP